jgi:hypothetical protein
MMTTLHTPGPWHIGIGNGIGSIFSETGRTRLEDGGTALYPIASINSGWNATEDAANARLITAAPAMLAALQSVARLLNDPDADHFDADRVQAEIEAALTLAGGSIHDDDY